MTASALDTLARYRTINARQSAEVIRLGKQVLAQGTRLGAQEWAVREQIAIAALDEGDIPFAQDQLARLSKKFPSSPRLLVLQGMYLEVRGQYASARIIYHGLLGKREGVVVDEVEGDDGSDGRRVMDLWRGEPDECLVTAHQRLITLELYPPSKGTGEKRQLSRWPPTPTDQAIARTVPLLTAYLDTFHSDPDAWSLLADLYVQSTPGMRTAEGWGVDALWEAGKVVRRAWEGKQVGSGYLEQALACCAQRVLLEPWDVKALVRFAEVGLLNGDVIFAYKTLLRAVEMLSEPYPASNDPAAADAEVKVEGIEGMNWSDLMCVGGWKTRVWWDLAVCTAALARSTSADGMSSDPPTQVPAVRKLVETRLDALLKTKGVVARWQAEAEAESTP
ncbi:hypothetical protein NliqN6_5407 [Naganishia liquefaciens]|uniref:ER membrane protein complex subunit 2 n=1 Tax=Naganishia liquefaciens TaxID=104408 RepID=A0A8H3YGL9_9TREE|nr:hypothetical protein NliqN6_5407 [Naganishia liquefaciens]